MDLSVNGKKDLHGLRAPYSHDDKGEFFSVKQPYKLFEIWFQNAAKCDKIKEVNAMAIASADKSGKPSVRYVLLKEYSTDGFVFFTNYNSRKGKELIENPQATLLFYWDHLSYQVRIEGSVSKVSETESEKYFHSRPLSSQISATISEQSKVIESKEILIKKKEQLETLHTKEKSLIPKPKDWGGFIVKPFSFEFWLGNSDRLHDRKRFRRTTDGEVLDPTLSHEGEDGWIYEFLAP